MLITDSFLIWLTAIYNKSFTFLKLTFPKPDIGIFQKFEWRTFWCLFFEWYKNKMACKHSKTRHEMSSFFGSHRSFCHSKTGLLRLNFKWHPKTATFGVHTRYYLGKLDLSCIWLPTVDDKANKKLLSKHAKNLKLSPFIVLNYIIMTPLANIERK